MVQSYQSGYLSLTGLVLNYALFAGCGVWLAGWTGAACGVGLVTALYARQIWQASQSVAEISQDAEQNAGSDQQGT